jgi:hypothetical protein
MSPVIELYCTEDCVKSVYDVYITQVLLHGHLPTLVVQSVAMLLHANIRSCSQRELTQSFDNIHTFIPSVDTGRRGEKKNHLPPVTQHSLI